jgi:hypothetical protein
VPSRPGEPVRPRASACERAVRILGDGNGERPKRSSKRAYRRAARYASGLSANVIEGLDVEIVVEVEMRKR